MKSTKTTLIKTRKKDVRLKKKLAAKKKMSTIFLPTTKPTKQILNLTRKTSTWKTRKSIKTAKELAT